MLGRPMSSLAYAVFRNDIPHRKPRRPHPHALPTQQTNRNQSSRSDAAVVDAAHQVVVEASAIGIRAERELPTSLLNACAEQRNAATNIAADAGYGSERAFASPAATSVRRFIPDHPRTACMRDPDAQYECRENQLS